MKQKTHTPLSQRRYAIARIIRYLSFLVVIIILFLPILSLQSVDEETELTTTVSISPFQFLIGQTVVTPSVESTGNAEADEFLNSLASIVQVDLSKELYKNKDMYDFMRIASIVLSGIVCLVTLLSAKTNTKNVVLSSSATPAAQLLQNNMYVTRVFNTLPRYLEALEKFVFSANLFSIFLFNAFAFILESNGTLAYSVSFIPSFISFIVLILIINGLFPRFVCAKDIRIINEESARYKEPYELPTISSDFRAIQGLFGNSNQTSQSPMDELYQYKKLLDDGIITEEEFQMKKNEIMNKKN